MVNKFKFKSKAGLFLVLGIILLLLVFAGTRWAANTGKLDNGPSAGKTVTFANSDKSVKIEYDLGKGTANYYFNGAKKIIGAYAGVELDSFVTSRDYSSRTYSVTDIRDSNGSGKKVDILNTGRGPTMRQTFYIYNKKPYFLSEVQIQSSTTQSSNWMGPLVMDTAGGVDIGSYSDNRVLWVPFDNDQWVRYNASSINNSGTSFEACAFYDNVSRNGLVVGSVEHDTWKTGINYWGAGNKLNKLKVYGGAANANWTHDQLPHGKVSGTSIKSPRIFVGFFSDWRTGMETFADVNTYTVPKLGWSGGVPFGWNSWGGCGSGLTSEMATSAANFIKSSLSKNNFNDNNTTYINLDSYWDNLSDTELSDFVTTCHNSGQKAGIYWAPFVYWGDNWSQSVDGTGYTYGDCVLRDSKNNIVSSPDGAYALDPTHPATIGRIDYYIDKFKSKGFDYIKLDFLSHGALEGKHYNSSVQTGIQAYNYGMNYVLNKIGGTMFVSLSIAPLFPYQYGHARRVSCDSFGSVKDTEYMLNSVSYGWWMNGILYNYNDPDHMTLYRKSDGTTYSTTDAKTRVNGAAIAGTVFLNGDDLSDTNAQNRASMYLTNANINGIARKGKTFKPVEGNTESSAADTFVLNDGKGVYYLAVFNYSTTSGKTMNISLSRAGLSGRKTYKVTNLWDNTTSSANGTFSITLAAGESGIFKLN